MRVTRPWRYVHTYVHGFDDKRLQRWSVSDSFKIRLNDNMRV